MTRSDLPQNKASAAAIFEAQRLAFAPLAFQVARVLRDSGVLAALAEHKTRGSSLVELKHSTGLSRYALRVLLEGGTATGLIWQKAKSYVLSKTGFFVLNDEMTRINMDFVHDVCFQGSFHLDEALRTGAPAGLKVFGDWPTIYPALTRLPPAAKKSWFAFDHYYSDTAFPEVLPIIFAKKPKQLLDIGGNTGRFALACVAHDPDVTVSILDLKEQLAAALEAAKDHGVSHRVKGVPIDLLDPQTKIPADADAIWMSQFLCCFSEEQIVEILKRVAATMTPSTTLWILDTYWDRQKHDVARYCLQMSSIYFAVMANGCSRMYHSQDVIDCVEAAGLTVESQRHGLGVSHTLLECRGK